MKQRSPMPTVAKALLGVVAFFGLLCVGFVFFVAVVCGKW